MRPPKSSANARTEDGCGNSPRITSNVCDRIAIGALHRRVGEFVTQGTTAADAAWRRSNSISIRPKLSNSRAVASLSK
jgi:hypothetical protein